MVRLKSTEKFFKSNLLSSEYVIIPINRRSGQMFVIHCMKVIKSDYIALLIIIIIISFFQFTLAFGYPYPMVSKQVQGYKHAYILLQEIDAMVSNTQCLRY